MSFFPFFSCLKQKIKKKINRTLRQGLIPKSAIPKTPAMETFLGTQHQNENFSKTCVATDSIKEDYFQFISNDNSNPLLGTQHQNGAKILFLRYSIKNDNLRSISRFTYCGALFIKSKPVILIFVILDLNPTFTPQKS